MKQKFIVLTAIFLLLYISNYLFVRQSNLEIMEVDSCPTNGCQYVSFPFNGSNMLYSPLILMDKYATGATIYIIQK